MSSQGWIQPIEGGVVDGETAKHGGAEGWLILAGPVPERWRGRAVPLSLIPLLPQETDQIMAGRAMLPGVTIEDEPLLRLLARGKKTSAIARELRIPQRTVERRLERFRRRFGVSSTADLMILLARLGFGPPNESSQALEFHPPKSGGPRVT